MHSLLLRARHVAASIAAAALCCAFSSSAVAQPAPATTSLPAPPPPPPNESSASTPDTATAQPAPPPIAAPSAMPPAMPPAAPPPMQPAPWAPPAPGYGEWPGYPGYYGGYGYGTPFALPPPKPKEPYNRSLMIGGILMTSGGLAALIAGSVLLAASRDQIDVYQDGPSFWYSMDDPTMKGGGIAMMIGGGIVAAVGIPLWIIGSKPVPVRSTSPDDKPKDAREGHAPVLRLAPTGASLSMKF